VDVELPPLAVFGPWVATDLVEVSENPEVLDGRGRWAVLTTFEGSATFARFRKWERRTVRGGEVGTWLPPRKDSWSTSLDKSAYCAAVESVRDSIARGEVYQANVCRTLRAELDSTCDLVALHHILTRSNPAPFAGALRVPEMGIHVASASPELFLRRSGQRLTSSPIKGTARTASGLQAKDHAENVMIVDLVRNDLGRICVEGSVEVPSLLQVQHHPGLVHLVSSVTGTMRPEVGWPGIVAAAFPPGSVTGAPKLAALEVIRSVEHGPRGVYCGAFGWVDADSSTARIAVSIRTFWRGTGVGETMLTFGTGAGITWSSSATAEWDETELKAHRLLRAATASGVA
jgi:para-aminobenzoate synthetase component I